MTADDYGDEVVGALNLRMRPVYEAVRWRVVALVRTAVAGELVAAAAALEARAAETLALTAVADDREEAAELRARAAGLREAAGLVRARGAAP